MPSPWLLPRSLNLQAEVKLRGGAYDGRTVWLEYEDFSRFQGTFK